MQQETPAGHPSLDSPATSQGPLWPKRLEQLSRTLRHPQNNSQQDRDREAAWFLLNASISKYLRIHLSRLGKASPEDLEDIASQKSLDLLRRIESGSWEMTGRTDGEIMGFLSKAARNGLLDHLREKRRRIEPVDEDRPEWDVGPDTLENAVRTMSPIDPPDIQVERNEFAAALRECAEQLSDRSRKIWFFRVFCGLSSREIACHPEVSLKASHVDVLLQRTRIMIRDCMRQKGHHPQEIPPGTFVELWKAFRLEEILNPGVGE
ncbi:MAG: sigma-70 family RNA polymerase sigma factor [Candidatus Eisenbacteria bacterium]|uniref:Sigma-70 family RNA polymerase sigma factor n=1 Tax=Eiseniibacteriota bacterium TaxID=2212470 RepID=A0A948S0S5_UNCEI|nr:sigma-70 family RNA polymerase sigma factor [Candidatus Eisenbacteria bacterium]MBU1950564.1 sigma-70 family RNA polymerase sigma factor [Candidatus Eisenbacteria bacterium]MBU2693238.1 sigma-70 family RNA polymerase sigma factor [Candidatus Eisenbacteria bacterium]